MKHDEAMSAENRGKVRLMNFQCDNLTKKELLLQVKKRIDEKKKSYIVFVNADVAVKADTDKYLRRIINRADFSLIDGMPLVWISRLYKEKIKERVAGSDFVPDICRLAGKKGWKVFLLGGMPGVPEAARDNLKRKIPGLKVAGTYSPPLGFEKDAEELARIIDLINQAAPDILVVCFGCPKQEKFIYEHYREYNAVVSVCAGATMDFLAGKVKRCPRWIGKIGMEWFYRFLRDPKRLFQRYFIDDIKIFRMAVKYRRQK